MFGTLISVIGLGHVYFAGEEAPQLRGARLPAANGTVPRVRRSRVPTSVPAAPLPSEEPLHGLVGFVLEASGLEVESYQPRPLRRRLAACLRALRAPSEEAALMTLSRNPELLPTALDAVLIGVSGFFRDAVVFDYLEEMLLPNALRAGGLRVLSVGCSAGQELYSLAMLLDEMGGLESSRLYGMDCRCAALEQASAGWFDTAELNGVAPERAQRYFRIEGARALIAPRLKQAICWEASNSWTLPQGAPFDLILFRNVAIYLKRARASVLWSDLAARLKPGGVLVTGKAERPPAELELIREAPCVYRKQLMQL
jgi:chemotaxis protein methyltransferase CheR